MSVMCHGSMQTNLKISALWISLYVAKAIHQFIYSCCYLWFAKAIPCVLNGPFCAKYIVAKQNMTLNLDV